MTEQATQNSNHRVGLVHVGYRSTHNVDVAWTAEVDFTKVIDLLDKGQANERPVFGVKIRRNGFLLPDSYVVNGEGVATTGWVGGLEPSATIGNGVF